ncbi:MAG: peptidoglycan bridge formation glycyltransferase FemA/FemB family protein [Gammaproteobacteria bacterium]|jgi:hypothetical protein
MDSSLVDNYDYTRITTTTVPSKNIVFRTEVDVFSDAEWDEIVAGFSDAVIYQTSSFGALRWGKEKLSRIVIYEGSEIVAAAQVAIVSSPLVGGGIAHCKFGPLWRPRNLPVRIEFYREILRALRAEYAHSRGLLLRIKPWEMTDSAEMCSRRQLSQLKPQPHLPKYNTFVVDMNRSIEELHGGLSRRWRSNLRKAQKNSGIHVTRSSSEKDAAIFMQLHNEMRALKTFVDTSEAECLPRLVAGLPEQLRPTIFTAYQDEKPVSSLAVSAIGETAFYLYAATGSHGRQVNASYLLFWEALQWVKERNCRWLDLVGSMPKGTGGYQGYRQFKKAFTGTNGSEQHMCDWEVSSSWRSSLVVHGATFISERWRASLHALNGLRVKFSRYPGGTRG